MSPATPTVLTIAGSDSGGGAGIQADLKTFQAHGTFGTSVITAVTAQNTIGVQGVHGVPSDFVSLQLKSILDDLPPAAIKIGMLSSSSVISSILQTLTGYQTSLDSTTTALPPIVLDPVMISTSNDPLLNQDAIKMLVMDLLPLATISTPNVMEAETILRFANSNGLAEVKDTAGMISAGKTILRATSTAPCPVSNTSAGKRTRSILIKGGHLLQSGSITGNMLDDLELDLSLGKDEIILTPGLSIPNFTQSSTCLDILSTHRSSLLSPFLSPMPPPQIIIDVLITLTTPSPNETTSNAPSESWKTVLFVAEAVESTSTHGTGCTLSAAIAANLALGMELQEAVRKAIGYTQAAIATAQPLGRGNGPINHQVNTTPRLILPPTPAAPYPFTTHLLTSHPAEWKAYTQHEFVIQLGQGSLSRERFQWYLIQDWHYLKQYARAHAMLAMKSTDFEEIKAFSTIALHIVKESERHVEFCTSYGLSLESIRTAPESASNSAYSRYILDIGLSGDLLVLMLAVFSCLIGYGQVGVWLNGMCERGEGGFRLEGNPYRTWIEAYGGEEFLSAVSTGITALETRIAADPPSHQRLARLTDIWRECVKLETNFWQMGLDMS